MPSPISFPPVDCPPATPGGAAQSNNDTSKNAPDAFDRALTQAAPSAQKITARTSVTGTARPSSEKTKPADTAKKSPEKDEVDDRSVLSPEELAALLALIGAPAALPPPPPQQLAIPTDFNPTGDTSLSDSADTNAGCEANFSTPPSTTGKDGTIFIPRASSAQDANTSDFSLPAGSAASAPSARELLAQGAEVIDYDLASASSPVAQTAPVSNPATPSESAIAAAITPDLTSLPVAGQPEAPVPIVDRDPARTDAIAAIAAQMPRATGGADAAVETARAAGKSAPAKGASEKIAAPAVSRTFSTSSGVKSSNGTKENNFLNVDDKEVVTESGSVGTRAAIWGNSMSTEDRSSPFAQRLSEGAGAAVGATFNGTQSSGRTSETAAAKTSSAPHAAQVVSEIRDIADGLWAVERNSVEVRFHFSENERLSVKVEYKDGVVQTTFRTDSPGLRDTIAREWQAQVASSSDSRPYRVADPVFNTPPADARGFSLGGDSSRQQRQAGQSSGNAPHTFATTSGRGPSSSTVATAPATIFTRPDTALHLHAFA